MATIIEQDGIRIEADTQAEAMKMLRKEQKRQAIEREKNARIESLAEDKAKARVFSILTKLASGEAMPSRWSVESAGDRSSIQAEKLSHAKYKLSVADYGDGDYIRATREVYCYGVLGVLDNTRGVPLIVWLKDSLGELPAPYAVAVAGFGGRNIVGLVPLPMTIQPETFAKELAVGL